MIFAPLSLAARFSEGHLNSSLEITCSIDVHKHTWHLISFSLVSWSRFECWSLSTLNIAASQMRHNLTRRYSTTKTVFPIPFHVSHLCHSPSFFFYCLSPFTTFLSVFSFGLLFNLSSSRVMYRCVTVYLLLFKTLS